MNSGAHARVYLEPTGTQRTGVVERITPDTMFLRACRRCELEAVPRWSVRHADVNIGGGGHPLVGAAIGLLAGTVFGVFVIVQCHDDPGRQLWSCGGAQFMGGVIGGFVGLFVGGALGRLWASERWRPARLIWPTS